MFIMVYTDGNSGISNIDDTKLKESIWDSTYVIDVTQEIDKLNFINAWENNILNISDEVYESLNMVFKEVKYCLLNKLEEKYNVDSKNGNYYIKIFKELNINNLTSKEYGDVNDLKQSESNIDGYRVWVLKQ